MDLIITDGNKTDIAMVSSFDLDLEYGDEDNDFIVFVPEPYKLEQGSLIYVDDSDIGGIVDKIIVKDTVEYKGRTFAGILSKKIICPPKGKSHYVSNGDANTCLRKIIELCKLQSLFVVPEHSSGININNYKWDRYENAWTGIRKMLRKAHAKPVIRHSGGKVCISAESSSNISNDVDSDLATFNMECNYRPVNHLVCAGQGELEKRIEIHFYADKNGRVSKVQTLFGLDEITDFYDYSSADAQKLDEEGYKKLKDYQVFGSIDVLVDDDSVSFDVGDFVTAYNHVVNKQVKAEVVSKIVKVDKGIAEISYNIGQPRFTKGFMKF